MADAPADVEKVLDEVEARGATVETLRCDVIYTIEDQLANDTVRRYGSILYKKKEPNPVFLVTFDKSVQDGEVSKSHFWYLFDGRWFYEALERSKSIIERDAAPPGEQIDLFSLDKAPFPVPFGQKKAEILKHFEVSKGTGENAPPNTDHIVCIPKDDSRFAKDYTKVEFFVSKSLLLPVKIVMTANPADRITTAEFPGMSGESINPTLPDSLFKLPPETKDYARTRE